MKDKMNVIKDETMQKTEQPERKAEQPEAKAETVTIWLPREGIGDALEGCLNGVNFRIPTEQNVEVPKRIAALIQESRRTLSLSSRAMQAYQTLGGRKLG